MDEIDEKTKPMRARANYTAGDDASAFDVSMTPLSIVSCELYTIGYEFWAFGRSRQNNIKTQYNFTMLSKMEP